MKIKLQKSFLVFGLYSFSLYGMQGNNTSAVALNTSTIVVAGGGNPLMKYSAHNDKASVAREFLYPNRAAKRLAYKKMRTEKSSDASKVAAKIVQEMNFQINYRCIDIQQSIFFPLFDSFDDVPYFVIHGKSLLELKRVKEKGSVIKELEDCALWASLKKIPMTSDILAQVRSENTYFNGLIDLFIDKKSADAHFVTGSTLDLFFNVKNINSSPHLPIQIKEYLNTAFIDNYDDYLKRASVGDIISNYDDKLKIRFKRGIFTSVPLQGIIQKPNSRFYVSKDQQFIKRIHNGTTKIWNLLTGIAQMNVDDSIVWETLNLSQTDIDIYNPKNNLVLYHEDSFQNSRTSTVMVRPTLKAIVCQLALFNSMENIEELTELLHSKTFKTLKGLPFYNLNLLIQRCLDQLKDLHRLK